MRRRKPNVFRDRELTRLFRDEPELLPIADAVLATQSSLWRRHRLRRLAPALAVGTLLVGITAALVLEPLSGKEAGIVEQALAAVPGEGSVTHVLARRRVPGTGLIHLETGREVRETVELELWFDTRKKQLRTVVRRDGMVVTDIVQGARASSVPINGSLYEGGAPLSGGAIAVFAMDYHAALTAGRVRPVRGGVVDDRSHPTLVVRSRFGTLQRVTLDRRRLVPVRVRHVAADGRTRGPAWNVVTTEMLPRQSADFSTPRKPFTPSGGTVAESRPVSLARARAALPVPAVWAGRRVRRLPLRTLTLETLTRTYADAAKSPIRSRGLQLFYGDIQSGRPDWDGRFLQIQQAAAPEPAYGYLSAPLRLEPPPPMGHLRLERRGAIWRGKLVRHGLYVTLAAAERETLLAGARSLSPIPGP